MSHAARELGTWLALLFCLVVGDAKAQSKLRPSAAQFPVPDALKSRAEWEKPGFLEEWGGVPANGGETYRTYRGHWQIFGHQAQSVSGIFEDNQLASITIVVLDAGAWFGFVPDVQLKQVAATKGPQFAALYKTVAADTERGLAALAGGTGRKVSFVEKGALKHDVQIFHCGDLWARLTCRDNQLVKLTLTRAEADAVSPLNAWRRTAQKAEQAGKFAGRVQTAENGDRLLEGVPIFIQGDRAYCGVATLAMAMQFMGLRLDTEDYADAAGIRFGSTRRSDIRGAYEAAGNVAGVHLPRTTRFDFARARTCIDAGFPVIAFRRWSQERDFIHTAFARRFLKDPLATLPKPDLNDQKSWPARDDYAHSSLITGYNAARREVIFTESWGEFSRNRRMRIEEMEGTAYYAYYPHL